MLPVQEREFLLQRWETVGERLSCLRHRRAKLDPSVYEGHETKLIRQLELIERRLGRREASSQRLMS